VATQAHPLREAHECYQFADLDTRHAEAHEHRLAILDLTEALAAMADVSDRLKSSLGKWPGLSARMTLVFHVIGIADARVVRHDWFAGRVYHRGLSGAGNQGDGHDGRTGSD
jgi:hypothetical protein